MYKVLKKYFCLQIAVLLLFPYISSPSSTQQGSVKYFSTVQRPSIVSEVYFIQKGTQSITEVSTKNCDLVEINIIIIYN